ncbi:MAG: hypothetical protein PHY47_19100 [Lachnospiraceae bacterium]|nr:hypothetical protein [Lachnospiraceae bacterium]
MKKENNLDKKITKALYWESNQIVAMKDMKSKIDKIIDTEQSNNDRSKISMVNNRKINRFVVASAALCVLITTGVFASGKITGYVTSLKPDTTYESYSDVAKAQEKMGISFNSVENFSNGYNFKDMRVSYVDKMDEDGNRVSDFKEFEAEYTRDGSSNLSLIINEIQEESTSRTPKEQKTFGDITVSFHRDHYKFVPGNYELTDEDKVNMERDDYYISYGSEDDVIEEKDYTSATWEKDGLNYLLMSLDDEMSGDEFFKMAEEVIEQ